MLEIQPSPDDAGAITLVPVDGSSPQHFRLWFPEIIWRRLGRQPSR